MTAAFDSRLLADEKRRALSWMIRNKGQIKLPTIDGWNNKACEKHAPGWTDTFINDDGEFEQRTFVDTPNPKCRFCGVELNGHQRVGALYLYYRKKALLADTMGAGKTFQIGALIGLMKTTGELGPVSKGGNGPAFVIPRSPALYQWRDELLRVMPGLKVAVADATPAKRAQMYLGDFDVILVGPQTFRRDYKKLKSFPRSLVVTDDVDELRNADTITSTNLDFFGSKTERYIIASGTPLQKKLTEVHSITDAIGGYEVFGDIDQFRRRYCQWEKVRVIDKKTGERRTEFQITGYKNIPEFKEKLAPLFIRRTAKDLKDVKLPAINPEDVFLDLYPKQRAKYEQLQAGVVKLLQEDGKHKVKHVTALSRIHYGAAICAGLASLNEPDGPMTSAKLDWIDAALAGDLSDEKVVIFARLKSTVRALQARLSKQDIGFVTIWGEEKKKSARAAAQNQFWDDDNCQVLIGTSAIEQSLNLQVSRHLINIDMILNPARMAQLAGRVRRQGSAFQHVFVHNLISRDTQEERYLEMIELEAALADHVWDESAELFKQIPAKRLLQLISPGA